MPWHLDNHKAIVLKFLTNQIKLTWTTTLLVAEGWETGGVSREWRFLQANCLDLINQSYWTIQMKTNGLGCLLWLPHMQQCMGWSIAFWGLQLKNREFLQTAGQLIHLFYVYPDWSIVKLNQSRLINSISRAGKMNFYMLIKLGQNRKKCMKWRIKTHIRMN